MAVYLDLKIRSVDPRAAQVHDRPDQTFRERIMPMAGDALTLLAPMLRVRPELQDFCRLGGDWRSVHSPEEKGWAGFHIVTRGACQVERTGMPPLRLEAGDILLLPHGDGHIVYGGGGRHEFRDVSVTYRDYLRVKETEGVAIETELICGRLHLEATAENLLLATLPRVIVLRLATQPGMDHCAGLVALIRQEVEQDRAGAAVIAGDLASALFVILLRQHFEHEPPIAGLLALLAHRETARAATAMLRDPAHDWGLDELAGLAAVSRATLVRAFKRICAMPPLGFLTELRLDLARDRIAHTVDTLGRIAADVGYQSEAALSRAMFRRFGIRPGALRAATPNVR
jgi:AraC family transcriptional activator of mtrCDE